MRNFREKRLGCRIPVDCDVRFKVQGKEQVYFGRTINLSVGGIAFSSDYSAEAGDLLELLVVPPEESKVAPLDTIVQVTRSNPRQEDCEIAGCIKEIIS